jgi:hypothetical protein
MYKIYNSHKKFIHFKDSNKSFVTALKTDLNKFFYDEVLQV